MASGNRFEQKINMWMNVAFEVSKLATCPRASAGAVITTIDYRILNTGYNGVPSGLLHCTEVGCKLLDGHCVRSMHAEENAIITRQVGISLVEAVIFCTHFPCPKCARCIIQSGIRYVFYADYVPSYEHPLSQMASHEMFKLAGIIIQRRERCNLITTQPS